MPCQWLNPTFMSREQFSVHVSYNEECWAAISAEIVIGVHWYHLQLQNFMRWKLVHYEKDSSLPAHFTDVRWQTSCSSQFLQVQKNGPVVKLSGIKHRANAEHKPKCFSKLDSVSSSSSHSKQGHRCLNFSFTRAKPGLLVHRGRQTQTYLNITFALSQIHLSQTEFSLIITRQKNYMNIFKCISWIAVWIITYLNKLMNTFL